MEKYTDERLEGEPIKTIIARPIYTVKSDGVSTPFEYWKYVMISGLDHQSPFYDSSLDYFSHEENVDTALISIFNSQKPDGIDVGEFLKEHCGKYYKALMANESIQPFFDYLIILSEKRKAEFRLEALKNLWVWIKSNPDYDPVSVSLLLAPTVTLLYKQPNKLSLRQIGFIKFSQGLNDTEAKKLVENSPNNSFPKMKQHYDKFVNGTYSTPSGLEGAARTQMLKDYIAVYPYLSNESKKVIEREIIKFRPEIKLPG